MELAKWRPINDLFNFNRNLSCMLDDMFYPLGRGVEAAASENFAPRVDIYEEGENFYIAAELPGVAKEDVTVDVKDNVLTLKGKRESTSEVKEGTYHRRERINGQFERAFRLPAEVNADVIKADFKDGVLKIEIPKPDQPKRKMITVH